MDRLIEILGMQHNKEIESLTQEQTDALERLADGYSSLSNRVEALSANQPKDSAEALNSYLNSVNELLGLKKSLDDMAAKIAESMGYQPTDVREATGGEDVEKKIEMLKRVKDLVLPLFESFMGPPPPPPREMGELKRNEEIERKIAGRKKVKTKRMPESIENSDEQK